MKPPICVRPLSDAEPRQLEAGLRSPDAFVLRRFERDGLDACLTRKPSTPARSHTTLDAVAADRVRDSFGCAHEPHLAIPDKAA
jgi:hypothetical protein